MLPLTDRQVQLMGTTIDTSIYHANPQPILDQVEELLHLYNHRFSANDDTSELMAINQAAGKKAVSVHPQLFVLIALGKSTAWLQAVISISLSALSFRPGGLVLRMPRSPVRRKLRPSWT